MEKEEEGLQRPQTPSKKFCGQETIRIREQKKRATLKIREGAYELKKLEKEDEQRWKKKEIFQRRQTLRVLQAAKKPSPQKASSEPDLRRTKKKSFKNLFGLFGSKTDEEEGITQEKEEEATQGTDKDQRRKWHSLENVDLREELLQKLEEQFSRLEKRLSINIQSDPISIESQSGPHPNEEDLEWQSNPNCHSLCK